MRIYIQPPYVSGTVYNSVRTALNTLRDSNIMSARPDGSLQHCGAILIEAGEVTKALAVLREAGMRAVMD